MKLSRILVPKTVIDLMKTKLSSLQRVLVVSFCGIIQLFFSAVGVISVYRFLIKQDPSARYLILLVPVSIVFALLWPIFIFYGFRAQDCEKK